jgi:membrane-bound metal-dependent hydrolase YbcI (DUF457 family)
MGIALYQARDEQPLNRVLEIIGGALGGSLGARLPDYLEPATSSWHRGPAHSWVAIGISTRSMREMRKCSHYCRQRAAYYLALRSANCSSILALLYALIEAFWRAASGFLSGLAAGYISHLALDAFTPRGIPLLCP